MTNILAWQSVPPTSLAERLEHHEIVAFAPCPFALPQGDARQLLLTQPSAPQATPIANTFAAEASAWLAHLLPAYARNWRPGQASVRAEEQATRKMWHDERDDLLHIDTLPARPTQGHRVLKLFVNLHPTEPRVWAKSESFADVLDRYGNALKDGDPIGRWARRCRQRLWSWLHPSEKPPSEYDDFMMRLRRCLRDNDEFQEKARRKFEHFAPGAAWLAFTDGFCHADLRGQFLLEQSFLVAPQDLLFPELAPVNLWSGKRSSSAPAQAA